MVPDCHRRTTPTSTETPLLGLVVEGQADFYAIPVLLETAGIRHAKPFVLHGQAVNCDVRKLVELRIARVVQIAVLKQVSQVLVIIDRENRTQCPGAFAQEVERHINAVMTSNYAYGGSPPIRVVCADRKLENWLIADPEGLHTHNYVVRDLSRKVGANADAKDGVALLKWAYRPGRYYHKTRDAPSLAAKVNVTDSSVRRRSHSLDKLLRECGVAPLC